MGMTAFVQSEAIIDAILAGRDAMAIMPTSAGKKSLCFQVPALCQGVTLVISPLISHKTQVSSLEAMLLLYSLISGQRLGRKPTSNSSLEKWPSQIGYIAPGCLSNDYF